MLNANHSPSRRNAWIASSCAAGVLTASALTLAMAPTQPASALAPSGPLNSPEAEQALTIAESLSTAFENVAEAIAPSVVNIQTTQEVQLRQTQAPQIPDEFRRFFGDRLPFDNQPQTPERRFRQGAGSGFVISDDGYIVTNNHVIENASDVTVRFDDGRSYTAEIVGADPQTDLAVIRVDASDLIPLELGDSDALRVGEFVVAAGSPFGLSSTITTGIVSATGRSRVGLNDYEDFIQTDAAINPGNSGGPLVNLRGEVIGVNSAILTRSGGSNGIGFAIPINMVKSVTDALIEDGQVTRGFLGVLVQDLTPELAQSFGFSSSAGALIADVQPDMPAAKAGLQPGDIVTKLNGKPISDSAELRLRVADIHPGEKARMRVFRDGEWETLTATIGDAPGSTSIAQREDADDVMESLGAQLTEVTPAIAERLGLPSSTTGVLVERVMPYGAAARSGLRPGEVIIGVGAERISSLNDFLAALHEANLADGVRLTTRTQAGTRFVFLRSRG